MSSQATYLSLADAKENFLAEDVETVVETPDYFDVSVTPPGEYLSASRKVTKVTKKTDGSVVFELTLEGGIRTLDETGQVFGNGKYPFRVWISTKLFTQMGKPGQTSGAAQFLRENGYDQKSLKTLSDVIDAMDASQSTPLKVWVAWTDRGVKQPDGSYKNLNLKTKDFVTGQNSDGTPVYSPVINVNGTQVIATEKIGSFKAYNG